MKSLLTTKIIIALILLSVWLDTLSSSSGRFAWSDNLEPALALVAMLCFYSESFIAGAAVALSAGILMDSLSPVPLYTAVFVGVFYASRLMNRVFYNPGSATHILAFFIAIFAARIILFDAGNGWPNPALLPFVKIISGAAGDFVVFALLVFAFHKKDQAVMYKMR